MMPPKSCGRTRGRSPTTSSNMIRPRSVGLSPVHVLHQYQQSMQLHHRSSHQLYMYVCIVHRSVVYIVFIRPTGRISLVESSGGMTINSPNDEAGCCVYMPYQPSVAYMHRTILLIAINNTVIRCVAGTNPCALAICNCVCEHLHQPRPCRVALHRDEGPQAVLLISSGENQKGLANTACEDRGSAARRIICDIHSHREWCIYIYVYIYLYKSPRSIITCHSPPL